MVKTFSISRTRLLSDPHPRRARAAPLATKPDEGLGFRPLGPEDLPWVQTWTAQLRLPNPGSARIRGFVLTKQGRRVGYLAARSTAFNTGQGREPVMWIVCAFLIPSCRGRGLLPRFCEMLSRAHFPAGKAAARIAADNAVMHRFMARGGWRQVRKTRRYTDYVLELLRPFAALKRG
jgi:hypothetical protein